MGGLSLAQSALRMTGDLSEIIPCYILARAGESHRNSPRYALSIEHLFIRSFNEGPHYALSKITTQLLFIKRIIPDAHISRH